MVGSIRNLAVAFVVFAASGAFTGWSFTAHDVSRGHAPIFVFGIPFALVSWFVLPHPKTIIATLGSVLCVPVWPIAHSAAVHAHLATRMSETYAICFGGFVGAAGVLLAFSVWQSRLIRLRTLITAALIGASAALGFVKLPILQHWNGGEIILGFTSWQAAVGTYACAALRQASLPTSAPNSGELL